jgi:hypothetical protein
MFVGGQVKPRQLLGDEPGDLLPIGSAADLGREPAHHLAHVASGCGTGGRDRL